MQFHRLEKAAPRTIQAVAVTSSESVETRYDRADYILQIIQPILSHSSTPLRNFIATSHSPPGPLEQNCLLALDWLSLHRLDDTHSSNWDDLEVGDDESVDNTDILLWCACWLSSPGSSVLPSSIHFIPFQTGTGTRRISFQYRVIL